MTEKIYFGEWAEEELLKQKRCFCECHTYPGVYPTAESQPCHVCLHVNEHGYFPGFSSMGWVEYWRSDRVDR